MHNEAGHEVDYSRPASLGLRRRADLRDRAPEVEVAACRELSERHPIAGRAALRAGVEALPWNHSRFMPIVAAIACSSSIGPSVNRWQFRTPRPRRRQPLLTSGST